MANMKKFLIIAVLSLFLISSCQLTKLASPRGAATTNTKFDFNQYNLGVCKSSVKAAQLTVNSNARTLDKLEADKTDIEAAIDQAKKIKDEPKVHETEQELKQQKEDLAQAQTDLDKAKAALDDAKQKCALLAAKPDKTLCTEFSNNLQKSIEEATTQLAKEKKTLEIIKEDIAVLKTEKNIDLQKLADQKKAEERQELEALKVINQRDAFTAQQKELNAYCKF